MVRARSIAADVPEKDGVPRAVSVLLVLLLAGLLLAVTVQVQDRRDDAPAPMRASATEADQAIRAAREVTLAYFTLRHARAAGDVARLRQLSSPTFRASYDDRVNGLVRRVRTLDLDLTARVPTGGVGLEYLTARSAQVLVAVDVTTTSAAGARTAPYRMRVVLQRLEDGWYLDDLAEVA
ncbi:hypothetical protein [Nocardioides sp.]|uniref:hypothetical protein n=1 Tax=Nocardioides sp. TaxID=35761 RepID=UPI0035164C50